MIVFGVKISQKIIYDYSIGVFVLDVVSHNVYVVAYKAHSTSICNPTNALTV